MAKVNRTYGQLLQVANAINILLSSKEHVEENTKGAKKLQKMGTKLKPHIEVYNEKLDDVRLDNAHTDESGALLLDEKGGYKYNKSGLKKLNEDVKNLLQEEFEFYQFTFSTEGLEKYGFLDGWVEGLSFPSSDDIIEIEEVD